jgi:hypothetical protein
VTTLVVDPASARAWIAEEMVAEEEDDRTMARGTVAAVQVPIPRGRGRAASWMIPLRRPRRRSEQRGSPLAEGKIPTLETLSTLRF